MLLTLRSVQAQFPKAKLFAVNFGLEGAHDFRFNPLPKQDSDFAADLPAVAEFVDICHAGKQVRCELAYQLGADTRWLAKIALGLGHTILGDAFSPTTSCLNLREALWTKDAVARANIPIRGKGYLSTATDLSLLALSGFWVLLLRSENGQLSFSVTTPSGKTMHIVICDDAVVVATPTIPPHQVFLTSPSLGFGGGPYLLDEYLAYKIGERPISQLNDLHVGMTHRDDLPPCR